MKTFKFEFVKLSLIWRCTNGPHAIQQSKINSNSILWEWMDWIDLLVDGGCGIDGRVGWLICGGLWAARGHNAPQRKKPAQPNSSFLSIYWRNWNKLRKKWKSNWSEMKLFFFLELLFPFFSSTKRERKTAEKKRVEWSPTQAPKARGKPTTTPINHSSWRWLMVCWRRGCSLWWVCCGLWAAASRQCSATKETSPKRRTAQLTFLFLY